MDKEFMRQNIYEAEETLKRLFARLTPDLRERFISPLMRNIDIVKCELIGYPGIKDKMKPEKQREVKI